MSIKVLLSEPICRYEFNQTINVETRIGHVLFKSTITDKSGKHLEGAGNYCDLFAPEVAKKIGLALLEGAFLEENKPASLIVNGYALDRATGLDSEHKELWYSLGKIMPKPVSFYSNFEEEELEVIELGIRLNKDNLVTAVEARCEDEEDEYHDFDWKTSEVPKEVFDLVLALVSKAREAKLLY